MTQRFFLLDGACHELRPGATALPKGAIEVPRLPGLAETWDEAAGVFVTDNAVAADMEVPAGHIQQMHLLKTAEAALILSGYTLTSGLLAREAAMAGIPISDLASQVQAQADAAMTMEISRRAKKLGLPDPAMENE